MLPPIPEGLPKAVITRDREAVASAPPTVSRDCRFGSHGFRAERSRLGNESKGRRIHFLIKQARERIPRAEVPGEP